MQIFTRRDLQRRGSAVKFASAPVISASGRGILVHNNDAADCPAGGLLAITAAHHPAGGGTDYFEGYEPTAADMPNVVIARMAIPAGSIGVCELDGLAMIYTAESVNAGDGLGSQASSFAAGAGTTHQVFFTEGSGARVYVIRQTTYNVEACA